MKHEVKGNTPGVIGEQQACRKSTSRGEGLGINADDIIRRLRQIYKVKSDSALAGELGLASSAPSNWRQRNSPPYAICAQTAKRKGVSLDWLIFGDGSQNPASRAGVRDDSGVEYRVSSESGLRIVRFATIFGVARPPEETVWLEQHLKRTVPEYNEWLEAEAKGVKWP